MYFENFPTVLYDFPVKDSANKFIGVKDITRNLRFKAEFIESISVYETYQMQDGETIEMVSEKVYGTPDYHWVLMLLNQRYDHIEDFALSQRHFDKAMLRKYSSRINDARYFVDINGYITNGYASVVIENTNEEGSELMLLDDLIKVGSVIRRKTAIGYYAGRVESIDPETKALTVMMTTGDFKPGDPIEVYNYYDDADGNYVETFLGSSTVTSFIVAANYGLVTNYEYEMIKNEEKRTIKIVPERYLSQIISEFDALVS